MRLSRLRRKEGFTLIELMIVVAIIGILAALAIPNFVRFQLRSKASEAKVNLAGIRTAEEGYFGEFGQYVSAAAHPASVSTAKQTWNPGASSGFETIGWAPEGDVYFQYQVLTNSDDDSFGAEARGDLDGDGTYSAWGYYNETGGAVTASWCTTKPGAQVEACIAGSGQRIF